MTQILPPQNDNVPQPYSRDKLREVLMQWHWAPSLEHPEAFPGPLAAKDKLSAWVHDVRKRFEDRKIPRQQWANALLSWIPEGSQGEIGFRERLLECMRDVRAAGQFDHPRFWKWETFKHLFFGLCEKEVSKNRLLIGATTVGSAIALPLIGIPLLGVLGFTSGGIAAGSAAAGLQSAVYGGATGGVFSVFQSIGARAAFPVAWNFAAGAIGGAAAHARSRRSESTGDSDPIHDRVDVLGDIGDYP